MKFALIQHDTVWNDRTANFAQLSTLIAEAADKGAGFILLPEMFSTGFVVDESGIGEVQGGPSSTFLQEMAHFHNVHVAGSCPELSPDDPRPYNSLVVASPDGSQHRYHKVHPFTYGGEHNYFRAGDSVKTIVVEGLRISLFVCYDLRFADEFWKLADKTDVYLVPANWPESRREHWLTLLRARAVENQAYVLGCNRVGMGGGLTYVGDSQIVDPSGVVLASGGSTPTIVYADIDAETVAATRSKFPFLQDRR